MNVYKPNGDILIKNVPITTSAEHYQEMSKSDYVKLSWSDTAYYLLSVGCYIIVDDVQYTILTEYKPTMKSEVEYVYEPEFQHPVMQLGYTPCLFRTASTTGTTIYETDWDITGTITECVNAVITIISQQASLTFSYSIKTTSDMPTSATVSFGAVDILSALNNIATAFETEYHIDWESKVIYFGTIAIGDTPIVLEEGNNVGVASVSSAGKDSSNYFIVRGGTRNITIQTTSGNNVESDTRLEIDDIDHSNGAPELKKILIFDDIYPHIDLYVYNVRYRRRRLKDNDGKDVVESYNEDGSVKSYKMYYIYFIRLAYQLADGTWNDFEAPKSRVINGKKLMASFEPNNNGHSSLAGREFQMTYHETAQTISENKSIDDSGIEILAGDYEINFETEGDVRIPDYNTLQPYGESAPSTNGDKVILFNIVMNDDSYKEYYTAAQDELNKQALIEIDKLSKDSDNYTLKKYPHVAINGLKTGASCTYKALSGYSLETRIIKLVTKLYNSAVVDVTIGNAQIKSSTQTLKEEVKSANDDIETINAMNNAVSNMTNALSNAQNAMIEAMSKITDMWQFDEKGNLFTPYNTYSKKGVSAYGDGTGGDVGGKSYFKDLLDVIALSFGQDDSGKTVVWNGSAWVKGTAGGGEGKTYTQADNYIAVNNTANTIGLNFDTLKTVLDGKYGDIVTHNVSEFSPVSGSSSIVTVGTITSGTWQGTAIADDKIASATKWNNKQDALTEIQLLAVNSGINATDWAGIKGKAHTHTNIEALNKLSLDENGKLCIDGDIYATGGISAYGDGISKDILSFSQIYPSTGEKIAEITINGIKTDIYAPSGSGGGTTLKGYILPSLNDSSTALASGYLKFDGSAWSFAEGGKTTWEDIKGEVTKDDLTNIIGSYYLTSSAINGMLTTGNYHDTLDSVYASKEHTHSQYQPIGNYVTISGNEVITGRKQFSGYVAIGDAVNENAKLYVSGRIHATTIDSEDPIVVGRTVSGTYQDNYVQVDNQGISLYTKSNYSRLLDQGGILEITNCKDGSTGSGILKIGDAYLHYDSTNKCLYVDDGKGGYMNFCSTGGLTAYGINNGAIGSLTDLVVSNSITTKSVTTKSIIANTLSSSDVEKTELTINAKSLKVNSGMNVSDISNLDGIEIGNNEILMDGDEVFIFDEDTESLNIAVPVSFGSTDTLISNIQINGNILYMTINGKEYKLQTVS